MNDLTKYNMLRPLMGDFDLLQWESDTVLGRLIQWFTGGDINHSGIVCRWPNRNRVDTIEALADGFQQHRLSPRLYSHRGHVYWHPLHPKFYSTSLHPKLRYDLMTVALDMRGIGYAFGDLIKQVVSRVVPGAKRVFCSEGIFIIGQTKGLPYPDKFASAAPYPSELPQLGWWMRGIKLF